MLYEEDTKDFTTLTLIDYLSFSKIGSNLFITQNRKIAIKLVESNVFYINLIKSNNIKEILRDYLLNKNLLLNIEAIIKLFDLFKYLSLTII